jgi:hypothetical protein
MIYGTELMSRKIDVDDKGSLDKAAVIAALGQSGDADYDSVSLSIPSHISFPLTGPPHYTQSPALLELGMNWTRLTT